MTAPNMTPAEVLAVLDDAASACARERDQHDANDAKPYADTWEKRRAKLRASHTAVAALIAERDALVKEVEALRPDAERWRAIDWRWEDERDMGPGGCWEAVLWVNKGRPSVNAAIDAARAEARR